MLSSQKLVTNPYKLASSIISEKIEKSVFKSVEEKHFEETINYLASDHP